MIAPLLEQHLLGRPAARPRAAATAASTTPRGRRSRGRRCTSVRKRPGAAAASRRRDAVVGVRRGLELAGGGLVADRAQVGDAGAAALESPALGPASVVEAAETRPLGWAGSPANGPVAWLRTGSVAAGAASASGPEPAASAAGGVGVGVGVGGRSLGGAVGRRAGGSASGRGRPRRPARRRPARAPAARARSARAAAGGSEQDPGGGLDVVDGGAEPAGGWAPPCAGRACGRTGSWRRLAAARIVSTGAGRPVQRSSESAPWRTRISSPSTGSTPRASVACASSVGLVRRRSRPRMEYLISVIGADAEAP